MKSLLLASLVACDAGAPRPQPVTPAPPHPAIVGPVDTAAADATTALSSSSEAPLWPQVPIFPPFIRAYGRVYTVVQLRASCIEATNLGGTHWRFAVEGLPATFVLHGGGHGIYGDWTTLPGGDGDAPRGIGRYYVAEVTLFRTPRGSDGLDCTADTYDGSVDAVVPAIDLDDARDQLARIPLAGFQPTERIDHMDYEERLRQLELRLPGR